VGEQERERHSAGGVLQEAAAAPGGLELLQRLIAVSEVVVENFSGRVMARDCLEWLRQDPPPAPHAE